MNTTATSFSSEHSWLATNSRRGSIESVLSIQGKETDYVCDTADTDSGSEFEYEPVSEPEELGPLAEDSSGDSDEIIATKVIEVKVGDDGDLEFADSEQTDSEDSDSELDLYDYWRCAKCQTRNNNPLYRYCEKCFKVRKNFFPPRPRPKQRCRTRNDLDPPTVTALREADHNTDSGVDSACTSQEFSQTQTNESPEPLEPCINLLPRKRRAESADRDVKRAKVDLESDSDVERDRKRKSKSADPEIKPLMKTISDPSLTIDAFKAQDNDMCIVCLSEPKSGVFVHGRIAHICCCYKCAVKVWATAKRCPVCNCKVSNVLKAVVM